MPRTLKRRSDAISRDDAESEPPEPSRRQPQTQTQQRQRRQSTSPASASEVEEDDNNNDGSDVDSQESDSEALGRQTQLRTLTKKLVRLALSCEYARQPLRRTDISAKIMKDASSAGNRVQLRTVFNAAQETLRNVFGMELVDLPSREKMGINERRKAASQKAMATQRDTQKERESQRTKDPVATAQNWILVSCLPKAYKVHPTLFVPSRAPDEATESTYIALCTLIVSIIYLHTPSGAPEEPENGEEPEDATEPISDAKLMRYLSRFDLDNWTPMGGPSGNSLDKLLARMLREGYLEKRKDSSGGEEFTEWVIGPRGKREIGRKAVAGLVRGVYGFGVDGRGQGLEIPRQDGEDEDEDPPEADDDEEAEVRRRPVKMERDELERRLKRTLGHVVALKINESDRTNGVVEGDEEMEHDDR